MSIFNQTQAIPKVFISQLKFNNGKKVSLGKDDIVVFVGPNNAGKSQTLRDIWEIADKSSSGTIVKKISLQTKNFRYIKHFLFAISEVNKGILQTSYSGFNFSIYESDINLFNNKHLGGCRNVFMCHLCTDKRLSVCNPPDAIDCTDIPKHPIHQIIKNPNSEDNVSKHFKKIFGFDLVPNRLHGKTVPLCIGNIPPIADIQGDNAQEATEWYASYLEQLPVLHEQGDGMRSLAGILLYLSIDFYRIFLIDEPESFLHPPQATIMGHVVSEMLSEKRQAFISTHSQHFIKGLLEKAPDRVKIIRITRNDNQNTFSVLDNNRINELLQDPLLKHSEVLDGMFYKNVVVCESDADCRFYSIINDLLKQQVGVFSETLFVHCGGKHRMGKIVHALKALNIDFRVIPDMDILNQRETFQSLIEICGGSWETFRTDYNTLQSGIESNKKLTGNQVITFIKEKLCNDLEAELSRSKREELEKFLEGKKSWDILKKTGTNGAPSGNASRALNAIMDNLKGIGIFIVPIGELECFVKEVGGHGPKWLNEVLVQHPDLINDKVFDDAKQFVSSWNI